MVNKSNVIPIVPRLVTIPQAAQYLATTTWAVRKMAWAKDIPHLRIGTRMLFDLVDLNRFIDRAKLGGKFGTACSAGGR
jgi:excisionase family DNA binding protein